MPRSLFNNDRLLRHVGGLFSWDIEREVYASVISSLDVSFSLVTLLRTSSGRGCARGEGGEGSLNLHPLHHVPIKSAHLQCVKQIVVKNLLFQFSSAKPR